VLVEIWSDIVCPWCAIGKARFEQALALFPNRDQVEVLWRSFELDPRAAHDLPEGLAAHLGKKYGSDKAGGQQMLDTMAARAAEEGLEFNFDIAQAGNTFDAHRLLHLAKEHGLQQELGARLFDAYLTEGRHIADHEVLKQVAVEAGLDEIEAKDVLTSDRYAQAVRGDQAQAQQYGISGVPFFVVDHKYGVSGAQPAEALLEVLQNAWTESHPLTMVDPAPAPAVGVDAGTAGGACDDGSCEI
jgi:predicted DsbA family dithiol-disulfide isomerase